MEKNTLLMAFAIIAALAIFCIGAQIAFNLDINSLGKSFKQEWAENHPAKYGFGDKARAWEHLGQAEEIVVIASKVDTRGGYAKWMHEGFHRNGKKKWYYEHNMAKETSLTEPANYYDWKDTDHDIDFMPRMRVRAEADGEDAGPRLPVKSYDYKGMGIFSPVFEDDVVRAEDRGLTDYVVYDDRFSDSGQRIDARNKGVTKAAYAVSKDGNYVEVRDCTGWIRFISDTILLHNYETRETDTVSGGHSWNISVK